MSSSNIKIDSEDMKYLKTDIGKVVAKGMAYLYEKKPNKPITHLAHWLLNYSSNLKRLQSIKKEQQAKDKSKKHYDGQKRIQEQFLKKYHQKKQQIEKVFTQFERRINNHEYHFELLLNEFPEFLQKNKHLTGVYIGELNHPNKKITDQDTDQNAHLDINAPKLINYIGSSHSHSALMIGKTLSLDRGVTAQAFNLGDEEEEGQEKSDKKRYIYIPDVVKNQRIHYFKIPKLGAYISIPLIYKSYLSEKTFDAALAEQKSFIKQKQEFQQQKLTQLAAIDKQLQQVQVKLKGHEEKNQHEQVATLHEELKVIQVRRGEKFNEQLAYQQPDYDGIKRQFVVCADTLGQDKQIALEDRQFLSGFVRKFKKQWQETEFKLLKDCVNKQLLYESKLIKPSTEIYEQINKALQSIESHRELADETLADYQILSSKHTRLKSELSKSDIQKSLLNLTNYRVIKFPSIIQNALYFLGHSKEKVDIPHTTHLNWKLVRANYLNSEFIRKLESYDYRGAKPAEVKPYSKISRLFELLDKINEQQVFHYNVGLGMLLKYLKTLCQLRSQDVEVRKQRNQRSKKERTEKLQENQRIKQEKSEALEQHKASLAAEELDAFNEEQWIKNYDGQHPLLEIPPEIHDDIDNDI